MKLELFVILERTRFLIFAFSISVGVGLRDRFVDRETHREICLTCVFWDSEKSEKKVNTRAREIMCRATRTRWLPDKSVVFEKIRETDAGNLEFLRRISRAYAMQIKHPRIGRLSRKQARTWRRKYLNVEEGKTVDLSMDTGHFPRAIVFQRNWFLFKIKKHCTFFFKLWILRDKICCFVVLFKN